MLSIPSSAARFYPAGVLPGRYPAGGLPVQRRLLLGCTTCSAGAVASQAAATPGHSLGTRPLAPAARLSVLALILGLEPAAPCRTERDWAWTWVTGIPDGKRFLTSIEIPAFKGRLWGLSSRPFTYSPAD